MILDQYEYMNKEQIFEIIRCGDNQPRNIAIWNDGG